MEPEGSDRTPHVPGPSLWPIGFAVGVAVLLTGLIVGWPVVLLGAILAVVFGALWVRDLTTDMRAEPVGEVEVEPQGADPGLGAAPALDDEPALPVMTDEEIAAYPRSKFLEVSTLGIGAAIGGLVTLPVLGMVAVPPFNRGSSKEIDIGPLSKYPEGQWRVVTFMEDPAEGEVTRRTAFVRYNGDFEGQPSFTMISNSCVHLGCPVQPNGPLEEEAAEDIETSTTLVRLIPTDPAGGFACPCHGGAYNSEGDRTSGPPVRALDRFAFEIRGENIFIVSRYSVGNVEGEGAEAQLTRYEQAVPGVHVDGPSALLYPIEPPK